MGHFGGALQVPAELLAEGADLRVGQLLGGGEARGREDGAPAGDGAAAGRQPGQEAVDAQGLAVVLEPDELLARRQDLRRHGLEDARRAPREAVAHAGRRG